MTLLTTFSDFRASVEQVDSLIANSHQQDSCGFYILPELDRRQITAAAFLNLFISWETFIESALAKYMAGEASINGINPVRYVVPPTVADASAMIVGVNRYFDFANIELVRKVVGQYFENGGPFEPHLRSSLNDIQDLRIMRNASAHITTSTRATLDALAQRLLITTRPGISLYDLLTSQLPSRPAGRTVLAEYRDKLLVTAELIANG